MDDDSKPKRASGGKRAVDAKHKKRDAARKRGPWTLRKMKLTREALGDPPSDPRHAGAWILRAQMTLAAEAMADAGIPPEQAREQASRILAAATKAIDSAKLRVELDELLALMDRRPTDGASIDGFEDRGGAPPTRQ